MKIKTITAVLTILLLFSSISAQTNIELPEKNKLYNARKIKNYLPHMSWKEAEEVLKKTDMVIIPLGSTEQHGYHLPLGTDFFYANEVSKILAQYADVVVAPIITVGLADHHMGFPGTISISPETFHKVVFESCVSLIEHGFRKFMFINGHGGNDIAVQKIIYDINHKTKATAINLGEIEREGVNINLDIDAHAGVHETSKMLYVTNKYVDMSKAEKPVLSIPKTALEALMKSKKGNPNLSKIYSAKTWLPKETGKKSSTREMTNTGVVSTGDPKDANLEQGKKIVEAFINAAVKFINDWKKLEDEN